MKKRKTDWSVLRYLTWFTQVGITAILPPLLFAYGAVWLQKRFGLGGWVVISGILLGVGVAICSLRDFLRMIERKARESERKHKQEEDEL